MSPVKPRTSGILARFVSAERPAEMNRRGPDLSCCCRSQRPLVGGKVACDVTQDAHRHSTTDANLTHSLGERMLGSINIERIASCFLPTCGSGRAWQRADSATLHIWPSDFDRVEGCQHAHATSARPTLNESCRGRRRPSPSSLHRKIGRTGGAL